MEITRRWFYVQENNSRKLKGSARRSIRSSFACVSVLMWICVGGPIIVFLLDKPGTDV